MSPRHFCATQAAADSAAQSFSVAHCTNSSGGHPPVDGSMVVQVLPSVAGGLENSARQQISPSLQSAV
jgi:hypothetical protein